MLDVVIIGGGICGCSLLYELSRYKLQTALLEKENDVGVATTKANSAIVHAGYDPEPGTMMARYNVEGNRIIEQLCADLDILYKKPGSLVVGFDEENRQTIEKLYAFGTENGVPGLRIMEAEELYEAEPNVSREATCALYAPSAGIVNPWELALVQAQCAVEAGAEVHLDTEVTGIRKVGDHFVVETSGGEFVSRFVVNAAGAESDKVSALAEPPFFTITPTRGQYYLLDTTQGDLVKHVVFPCPTKLGKGVLVSPTVHGNLIVGPDSEVVEGLDVSTTREGLDYVRNLATHTVPLVNCKESIRNFAGVRATPDTPDFIVGESQNVEGFFNIAGIKSPGLTSAPAIAKDVAEMLLDKGLGRIENPNFVASRKIVRFKELSDEERGKAIADNPLYGTIVCRCETVTEGEIVDAIHRPIPPRSVDGIKRRCTPGMGRCQGGFCGPRVQAILSRELNVPMEEIPLDRDGMEIITGRTKSGKGGNGA